MVIRREITLPEIPCFRQRYACDAEYPAGFELHAGRPASAVRQPDIHQVSFQLRLLDALADNKAS